MTLALLAGLAYIVLAIAFWSLVHGGTQRRYARRSPQARLRRAARRLDRTVAQLALRADREAERMRAYRTRAGL